MNKKQVFVALQVSFGMLVSLSAHAIAPPSPVTALTNKQVFAGISPIWFNWTNAANATGVKVERSTNNKTWTVLYSENTTLINYYSDGSAALNASYYYRVTALNALSASAPVELSSLPLSHKIIEAQYTCSDSHGAPLWVIVYLNSSTYPPQYQGAFEYDFGVYRTETNNVLMTYQTYDYFPVTSAQLAAAQAGGALSFSNTNGTATYNNTKAVSYEFSGEVRSGTGQFSASTTSGPVEGFQLSGIYCGY